MATFLVTPRDPLIVRDGRPNDGQSQSETLPFPFPGTLAGLLRTAVGSDPGSGFTLRDRLDELRAVAIRGPLLVARPSGAAQAPPLFLAPAPADATFEVHTLDRGGQPVWRRLPVRPIGPPAALDVMTDGGLDALELVSISPGSSRAKTPGGVPAFWPWATFSAWLEDPCPDDDARPSLAAGIRALDTDERIHVRMGEDGRAEDGMLFSTTGLIFGAVPSLGAKREQCPPRAGRETYDLSLWLDAELPPGLGREVMTGLRPFGAERRLTRLEGTSLASPATPGRIISHLDAPGSSLVRIVLLTPGMFAAGFRPGRSSPALDRETDVTARLIACAVGRPQTVSGWDLATRTPKACRRVAPAGSVYWIELDGSPAAKRAWLERVWMRSVSDDLQDRRDGYGLAAVGVGLRWPAGGVA